VATASLNPEAAVAEIPGAHGALTARQIHRPPLLLERLRIPCACGLRLAACRYEFHGDTLHVNGLCLECGVQQAIFAPPPIDERAQTLDIVDAMIAQADELVQWSREGRSEHECSA